jgi:hypothetical protein
VLNIGIGSSSLRLLLRQIWPIVATASEDWSLSEIGRSENGRLRRMVAFGDWSFGEWSASNGLHNLFVHCKNNSYFFKILTWKTNVMKQKSKSQGSLEFLWSQSHQLRKIIQFVQQYKSCKAEDVKF